MKTEILGLGRLDNMINFFDDINENHDSINWLIILFVSYVKHMLCM